MLTAPEGNCGGAGGRKSPFLMFQPSLWFEAAIQKNRNVCSRPHLAFRHDKSEKRMTKLRLLGAAALVLSSALAGPAMAQQVIYNPGYCAQFYPNANCQNKGPGNPYTGDYQRRTAYQNGYDRRDGDANWNNGWHDSWNDNRWDRHDSGFWPADVAADVVGGAVGTAGAIATAPFRGSNSYAYDNGYRGGQYGHDDSYAARNGFVCQPGTWFKGEDGRRHPCQ
jgi:hypothetical protein